MDSLHAQNLIVALFVIEHRCSEVVEYIFARERSIGLSRRNYKGVQRQVSDENLYPFMPDEKTVTVVVLRVEITRVHHNREQDGRLSGKVDHPNIQKTVLHFPQHLLMVP